MSVFGSIFGEDGSGKGLQGVALFFTAGAGSRGKRPGRSVWHPFIPAAPRSRRISARPKTVSQIGGACSCALSPQGCQSGRSMIEMLAVLAIMGILTVGGIAAYSFAVSKHRANQIYSQVDLRAVTAFSNPIVRQTQTGKTFSLPGFDDTFENLPYEHTKVGKAAFEIKVTNVPQKVCRRLQDMTFKLPRQVTLNGEDVSSACGAQNTFVFVYDGLSVGKPSSGVTPIDCDCSGCQSCESGTCQDNDNLCGPKEVCVSGRCQCAPDYTECRGGCYTACGDGLMRDPISCDCVCEEQTCPEYALWDETTCSCQCDTDLGFSPDLKDGQCVCPVGSVFLDGRCQTFGCTGGTKGNQDWTCQIDGQRCGAQCFEDGSMCFNGLCTAGQCPNTPLAYIPVAALYGCLNVSAVEGQDVICTKRNSVIHCYRADKDKKCGYYCSLTGKDCTWGDCEDRCTTDSTFPGLAYADSGSYEFWGCRNEAGLVCVSIGASATNYACYQDGYVCASGCTKDGSTCLNNICDTDNPCPAGSTYDPVEFTCTRADGVWCSLSPYAGSPRVMCFMPGGLASCGAICTWDGHGCNTGTCDASDCSALGMDLVSVEGWYGCKDPVTQVSCLKRDNGNYFHCYKDGLLCGTTCTDYAAGGCSDCLTGYECPNGGTYIESGGYADNTCLYDNGLSCSPWTKNCFINGLPCGTGCAADGTGCASGVCTARDCPSGQEPVYDSATKLFTCAVVDRTVSCTDGTCTINGSLCGQGCASDGSACSVGVCLAEECGDAVLTQISYQFYGCYSSETGTGCYRNGTTYTCWKNGSHCGDGCTINGTGGTCDTGCI